MKPDQPRTGVGDGKAKPKIEDRTARALSDALSRGLWVLRILMMGVVVVALLSGVFTVQPNEVAILSRFGKPVGEGALRLLGPGLHWGMPYPVDEVTRVSVGQSHVVVSTIGWYRATVGQEPAPRGSFVPGEDGYTITADGNVIHARATLKYRIQDPLRYTFRFQEPGRLVENLLDNALLDVSAQFTADAAIYGDRVRFKEAVQERVRESLEVAGLGVTLDPFDLQVVAPVDVRGAFQAVLAAEQDRSRKVNDARGYANEVTLRAEGEAEALRDAGRSLSNRVVSAVHAEGAAFREQLPYYERNPSLFTRRRLAETMESWMTNAQDKFLLPPRQPGEARLVRLQLGREPAKPISRENRKP